MSAHLSWAGFTKKNDIRFPDNVRYGDIVKGLPVADNCCDFVYCSHVLEHLALDSFYRALQNTKKILKPGGVFRLVVPDLEHSIKLYQSSDSPLAAIDFLQESLVGVQSRPRGIRALLKEHLGNSRHLWMWDYNALAHELQAQGFTNIRRAYYGDSEHSTFQSVEEGHRWKDALGVECQI